ncbi:SMC-Scp complex subunit ScpB [Proluteimonas luteida]|uniref:SMC-Scp complex subunit ScpB n=1 Tax=Proluteimonas luteida TaxID=2878685 RepID=UPI003F4A804A
MDQSLINRIVEAALLAATQPLTKAQLEALFTLDEPAPEGSIAQALADLQAASADRGVELVELASGWRFQVKHEVHGWVARLWTERQTKYTRATLETLALIAYRQPITRGEIEQVRGVATNSNIIKALEEREWIRVVGHRDMPGRPELLGTTKTFLDYFGLKRLDELPPLSELKDFAELDPQMRFNDEGPRGVGGVASGDADEATADADAAANDDGGPGGEDGSSDEVLDIAIAIDESLDIEVDRIDMESIAAESADAEPADAGAEAGTHSDADAALGTDAASGDPPATATHPSGDEDTDAGTPPDAADADAGTAPSDPHPEPQDALAADGDSDRSNS